MKKIIVSFILVSLTTTLSAQTKRIAYRSHRSGAYLNEPDNLGEIRIEHLEIEKPKPLIKLDTVKPKVIQEIQLIEPKLPSSLERAQSMEKIEAKPMTKKELRKQAKTSRKLNKKDTRKQKKSKVTKKSSFFNSPYEAICWLIGISLMLGITFNTVGPRKEKN